MYKDANEIKYELVKVFNHLVLFTPYRIRKDNLNNNIHVYEIRYDDEINFVSQIGRHIMINFWGTIISRINLLKDNELYLDINESDVEYTNYDLISLNDYLRQKYIAIKHEVIHHE